MYAMNKITQIIMRDVGNENLTDEDMREIDEMVKTL